MDTNSAGAVKPPTPARALIDMDWLYKVEDRAGKPFDIFCAETAEEKKTILKFTFNAQPSDPTQKDQDNAKTAAYIARVNYLQARFAGYHTKVKGIVAWTLKDRGLNSTMVERVAPAFVSEFQEEAETWAMLSDSLHERLWTGRADLNRLNRAGE